MSGELHNVVFSNPRDAASGGMASPPRPHGMTDHGAGGHGAYNRNPGASGYATSFPPAPDSPSVNLDFYTPDTYSEMNAGSMSQAYPAPSSSLRREDTMSGLSSMPGMYAGDDEDYSNEPPLLEELDINFSHMIERTKSVLQPFRAVDDQALVDADLTGPLCFCLLLGFSLLLQGKVHFGYIYGYGVSGCISLYLLLNLLAPANATRIYFWTVASTLGYCLLPVVLVAVLGIILDLTGFLGNMFALVSVLWSTYTATRQFESLFNMRPQRYLVAYPTMLLYSCFVLISIF